jgi:hypothetical protein
MVLALHLTFNRDPMLKAFRLNRATNLCQLTGEFLIGQGINRNRCSQKKSRYGDQYTCFHNALLIAVVVQEV